MNSAVLHVASAYTNPVRFRTRRELFCDFRRHMSESSNVRLHVGEAAYGDRDYEVTSATNSLDLQLRTRSELWHKENLLNLTIQRFPDDWEYGAIIDGDFTMTRRDWALEAIHQLQHYDFVQLFSTYADLGPKHRPFRVTRGFAFQYCNGLELPKTYSKSPGATGGAWAFRRSAFDTVGGLLDTCILGSGDWNMAFGLVGKVQQTAEAKRYGTALTRSILRWQDRAAPLQANIGYIDNHAIHHFHGSKVNRAYGTRWQILRDENFDPDVDIKRDWQGLWQLAGNKPSLRDKIRCYFRARSEDDTTLYGGETYLA